MCIGERALSLHDFLRLLRERWLPIVLCIVLGLAASTVSYLRTPPQYTSTVTLFMSAPVPFNNPAAAFDSSQVAGERANAYAQLANSERLAQNVISSLSLDESPGDLASSIGVTHQQSSVIIQASVTNNSADQAATLANAVGDAFIRLVEDNERTMDPKQAEHVDAHVVQAARPAAAPQSPKLLVNLALGLIVGLLVGIGIEFFRRILDVTIRSEHQLAAIIDGEALGTVPFDRSIASHPLIMDDQPQSPMAEALRKIRVRLPLPDEEGRARIIVVTSAVPGEGRTLVVGNLAMAVAEVGSRVLVVEADMRRPRMSEYFGLPHSHGLSDALREGKLSAGRARLWSVGGFDVITAGTPEPNPSRLLSSGRMTTLLEELRGEYDYILIDTPPVLPVVDAATLMPKADGVVLVVRSGRTSPEDVAAAAAAVRAASGNLLGGVLSMDRSRFRPTVRSSQVATTESTALTHPEPRVPDEPAAPADSVVSADPDGSATVAEPAITADAPVPGAPPALREPVQLRKPVKLTRPVAIAASQEPAEVATVAEPKGSTDEDAPVAAETQDETTDSAHSDGPMTIVDSVESTVVIEARRPRPRPHPRPRPRPVDPAAPPSGFNGSGAALAAAPSTAFSHPGRREGSN